MTGSELRHLIKTANITQKDFAALIPRSLGTVSRWCNGHEPIPEDVANHIHLMFLLRDLCRLWIAYMECTTTSHVTDSARLNEVWQQSQQQRQSLRDNVKTLKQGIQHRVRTASY